MNVHLTYDSGTTYTQYFQNFDVKVTRKGNRVKLSFRDKGTGKAYMAFSLPVDKFRLLAHGTLAACSGDVNPIEFAVEEATKAVAA